MVRRSLRGDMNESTRCSSDSDDTNDAVSARSTPAKSQSNKRKSVVQLDAERQDKRLRDDMEIRRHHFEQQMESQARQLTDRIALERELQIRGMEMEQARVAAQAQAEERSHRARHKSAERNRALILECVKVLSEAFSKTNEK